MKRLMITLTAAASLVGGLAAVPAPAFAQVGQGTVTIYGNDPCPAQNICVRAPESQRYRLPNSQNPQGTRQQRRSWARQAQTLNSVGATGAGSCSAVGPGGFTGCLTKEINENRKANRESQQNDTPPQ